MAAPAKIAAAPDLSPRLIAISAAVPRTYPLAHPRISIGADSGNDIALSDSTVSRVHAEIRRTRRGFTVTDLGSTNGTFVNGNRIKKSAPLKPGDEVGFGSAQFRVAGAMPAASRIGRRIALALSLVALAAIGFLGAEFVLNWNGIEQLRAPAVSPSPAVAVRPGPMPLIPEHTASTAAARAHPSAPVAARKSAAAAPAAEAPGPPAGPEPEWLADVNQFRTMCGLPRVADDPTQSDADRKHAIYLVKNFGAAAKVGLIAGADMHSEDPSRPYYTPEGRAAAAVSDINQVAGLPSEPSSTWAIDNWIAGPFHRLWILNPALRRAGYGQFCENSYCVAALDLGDGAAHMAKGLLPAPVLFPPQGSTLRMRSFANEWPNPLTSCPGYSSPAGLPLTVQVGNVIAAQLSAYSISRDGEPLEACGIDATNYRNPAAADQQRVRDILHSLGAVVIVPRHPLAAGTYDANATVNSREYKWSFRIAK